MDNRLAKHVDCSSLAVGPADSPGAVRADAGYARGREYSGLPRDSRQSLVLDRARCGSATTPRDGGEAQAGVEAREGGGTRRGGEPFFGRARCGAPCLAPDWDEETLESRRCTESLTRFDFRVRLETGTGHGRRTPPALNGQTKTARGGFVLNYAVLRRGSS
jgi:hypothetical protein